MVWEIMKQKRNKHLFFGYNNFCLTRSNSRIPNKEEEKSLNGTEKHITALMILGILIILSATLSQFIPASLTLTFETACAANHLDGTTEIILGSPKEFSVSGLSGIDHFDFRFAIGLEDPIMGHTYSVGMDFEVKVYNATLSKALFKEKRYFFGTVDQQVSQYGISAYLVDPEQWFNLSQWVLEFNTSEWFEASMFVHVEYIFHSEQARKIQDEQRFLQAGYLFFKLKDGMPDYGLFHFPSILLTKTHTYLKRLLSSEQTSIVMLVGLGFEMPMAIRIIRKRKKPYSHDEEKTKRLDC